MSALHYICDSALNALFGRVLVSVGGKDEGNCPLVVDVLLNQLDEVNRLVIEVLHESRTD
jgi:hypothetical protein